MPPSGGRECGGRRSLPNSLPFRGRGVRWGKRGSDSAAFDHLLPPAGPSRGLAGRGAGAGAAARPGALRAGALFAYPDNLFLSFPDGAFFLWGTQEGSRLSMAGNHNAAGLAGAAAARRWQGAERSPLPLFGTSQTFLSWLLGSAGGGERWGRGWAWPGKGKKQQKANKQTKTVECQRLSRFITALS